MSRIANKILFFEIISAVLMILGVLPQEFSYVIVLVVAWGFYKTSLIDSLGLFIVSVPFFTALPGNRFSDSMSIWRILIAVLFIKMIAEAYGVKYKSRGVEMANAVLNSFLQIKEKKYGKLFILLLLFLAANLISLIGAQYVGAGMKKILFILNISLLFPIVLVAVKDRGDIEYIIKYMFRCSFIVIFIGYFQLLLTFFVPLFKFWQFWTYNVIKIFYGQNLSDLLSYSNTWFSYYESLPATLRMFSVFPDSHSFSMFILLSMPVLLFFLLHETGKERKKIAMLVPIYLLGIYFSGSRGVWASYPPAFLIFFVYMINLKGRIRGIKGFLERAAYGWKEKDNSGIIAYSMAIFVVLMPISGFVLRENQIVQLLESGSDINDMREDAIFKRLISISNLSEVSNMGRIEIWNRTIDSINKHYFFGVGTGNFSLVLDEKLATAKMGASAHSIYLDVAAETGVFGLMFFVFIICEILRFSFELFKRISSNDHLKIFAGAFFAYFLWIVFYGFFDVVLLNDKVMMFFVISVAMLYSIHEKLLKNN